MKKYGNSFIPASHNIQTNNRGGGSNPPPPSNGVQNDIYIYIPSGAIENEQNRLATFSKYPNNRIISVNKLAKAGFYFTGKANGRTICFSCGSSVMKWNSNDNPEDRRFHSNDCSMLSNSTAADNIPLSREFKLEISTTIPKQTSKDFNFATIRDIGHKNCLQSLNLNNESDRMRSYGSWPATSPASMPARLCKNGFFYLGDLDRVQCVSCRGVMRNWSENDAVEEEHMKYFPNCILAKSMQPLTISSMMSTDSTSNTSQIYMGIPQAMLPDAETKDLLKQLYPCTNSNNPHMSDYQKRLETFDSRWSGIHIVATKKQIAEAGFFYLGDSDRTKCWYCSGGLQNWERNDNPWLEHAKWFPGCEFMLREFGPEFIKTLYDERPNIPRPSISNAVDFKGGIAMLNRLRGSESIVDAFLQSEMVEQIKPMGFSSDMIKHAVQRKYQTDGQVFTSFDGMLEYLLTTDARPDEPEETMEIEEVVKSSSCAGAERKMPTASGIPLTVLTVHSGREIDVPLGAGDVEGERLKSLSCVCKLCGKNTAQFLCTPCGHVLCGQCNATTAQTENCAKCKEKVDERIVVILS